MKNLVVVNIVPSGVGGIQTYGKTLEKRLTEEGITVKRVEAYKVDKTKNLVGEISKKVMRFIANLIILSQIIKNYKQRKKNIVIHAHVGKDFSFWENSCYGLWSELLGAPFVFHVHSSLLHIEYKKSNRVVKGIRRYILSKAARIIALSEYWKRQLLQIDGIPSEKIAVIYNFVDIKRFSRHSRTECRKILNLPFDKKIVFGIGRLVERKGYQYLVEAVPYIVEKRKDVVFFIGGKGPLKNYLERQIRELGVEEHVILLGFVPDDTIPVWLKAADIFVMPSTRETFPIVMLEALASGTPFIGSAIGAVPEIITSEEFGLLCEPANPKDLAEKILTGLEKKWNREKIRKYAERFTWENVAERVLKVYREVVK
ncbi:MAG: glycosyltransferase family 4 protein [Archaeoglobus sp.]|uniref:glycosyltransferase family 4 protein n=1 Tax=Archaeoglobus sp. TaxID=1872626 RepID=UPI001DF5880B|nr:glycosyltransferase family 4 protein [Archaeoglobus sp.]MBO8181084.1 glycosyltransferase family 4 protein [Archaeoglobus sp.]